MTHPTGLVHNLRVQLRKPFAAAFLLMTVAALPVFGLAAHALEHHGHTEEAAGSGAEWSDLGEALAHGHVHADGTPGHEHYLLPSPSLRPDPPRDLQAPAITSLTAPAHLLLSSVRRGQDLGRLSGSSPPRLQLLCTLLI